METWKIMKKVPIMEFEKTWIIMEKWWDFVKYFDETISSQKLAVRHTKLVCLTASFLATGGFKC